jgi:hypothetical protein
MIYEQYGKNETKTEQYVNGTSRAKFSISPSLEYSPKGFIEVASAANPVYKLCYEFMLSRQKAGLFQRNT